eukprot:1072308-Amphidinium_carterae.2
MYGRFARAKSAWIKTSQHLNHLLMASCVPVLLYSNVQSLACTVTTDHLRIHFASAGEVFIAVCLHTCILHSAAPHKLRLVKWAQPESMARTKPSRRQRFLPHEQQGIYIVVLRMSADSISGCPVFRSEGYEPHPTSSVTLSEFFHILFKTIRQVTSFKATPSFVSLSFVASMGHGSWSHQEKLDCLIQQAVPGFLKVSGFWQWVMSSTVTILSALATSFGLDLLTAKLGAAKDDRGWLKLLAMLLASIVLPGLTRRNRAEHTHIVLDIVNSVPFKLRVFPAVLSPDDEGAKPMEVNPRLAKNKLVKRGSNLLGNCFEIGVGGAGLDGKMTRRARPLVLSSKGYLQLAVAHGWGKMCGSSHRALDVAVVCQVYALLLSNAGISNFYGGGLRETYEIGRVGRYASIHMGSGGIVWVKLPNIECIDRHTFEDLFRVVFWHGFGGVGHA